MARAADHRIRVATMGWIFRYATRVPLKAPHRQPMSRAPMRPTTRGMANSSALDTEDTPKPATSMQQKEAHRDMTEPTEMSVPAEADTTRVMPMARMATSLPRLSTSMRRPYRAPLFMEILKKL